MRDHLFRTERGYPLCFYLPQSKINWTSQ
jgi:hypothetical protein